MAHQKQLTDADEPVAWLIKRTDVLGSKLGAVLFQLPPYLRCDLDRLARFQQLLPEGYPAAFEFRHRSWVEDDEHREALDAQLAKWLQALKTSPAERALVFFKHEDAGAGPRWRQSFCNSRPSLRPKERRASRRRRAQDGAKAPESLSHLSL